MVGDAVPERKTSAAVEAVMRSLQRIADRDRMVRAWLHVDAAGSLATARLLDGEAYPRGPLHGVPIGVKDVFDTRDMLTTHNSPLFSGHRPTADAACVETLRAAGAIILGKTDTTEFAAAGRDAVTANPHDPERTPGGSSAGSAAAVADGHIRIALATQTGGSTIRPASYCGVYGFKPTWGLVSREGVKIYANSLDTVGWHATSIDHLDLLCAAFDFSPPLEDPPETAPLRIGLCRTPFWDDADADCKGAVGAIVAALRECGAVVEDVGLPRSFDRLNEVHRTILLREGGAAFLNLLKSRSELLHADFRDRALNKAGYSDRQLRDAYDQAAEARVLFEDLASPYDAVLAPSASGIAPLGRGPGNPVMNQLWTLLHVPVVSLPLCRGAEGMPIGISLVRARFEDRQLLAVARSLEGLLATVGIRPTCAVA